MCSQNFGLIPTLRVLGETLAIWRGVGGCLFFLNTFMQGESGTVFCPAFLGWLS